MLVSAIFFVCHTAKVKSLANKTIQENKSLIFPNELYKIK